MPITLTEEELYSLPVHGPQGRIAAVRRALGMRQQDFADALVPKSSRETVSHWENLDDNGEPRQRTTRTSASAIADLCRRQLGLTVPDHAFHSLGDNVMEAMRREQERQGAQLVEVLGVLAEITRRLESS